MRIIGAGVGRTGTTSLKQAIETLTGEPCYHMIDLFKEPDGIAFWQEAAQGASVDWKGFFSRFSATIDWPSAAFWREQLDVFPEALVLLSERPAEDWWKSADNTIFPKIRDTASPWRDMMETMLEACFTQSIDDKDAAIDAYLRHNAEVVEQVPPEQLIRWQPGDGWEPICRALGVDIPEIPFPHTNTTAQFQGKDKNTEAPSITK